MKIQFIIGLFSVLLLSAIAVIIGTTIATQIQPAYSQARHCELPGIRYCVTPGQDPTITTCSGPPGPRFCDTDPASHQEAGQAIGDIHQTCSETQPHGSCVVLTPTR